MRLVKKGLIYCPENLSDWQRHTFLTPCPYLLSDSVIRLYGGFRDDEGVSRLGYIDVNAQNPSEVLGISEKPVLDIGAPGCFDDNGMLLGSLIKVGDELRMYYVGFQLVKKAKFLAFTGLAVSHDGGDSFERYQDTPVLDRFQDEKYIRAIHSILYEENKFKIWYAAGLRWQVIGGVPYPQYQIRYLESEDGIRFPQERGLDCILPEGDEYRIGRPVVFKEEGRYKMLCTSDTLSKIYSSQYAESADGKSWQRKPSAMQVPFSETGWDSESACYPVPLHVGDKTYLFYSGNGMGRSGVGYAELITNE